MARLLIGLIDDVLVCLRGSQVASGPWGFPSDTPSGNRRSRRRTARRRSRADRGRCFQPRRRSRDSRPRPGSGRRRRACAPDGGFAPAAPAAAVDRVVDPQDGARRPDGLHDDGRQQGRPPAGRTAPPGASWRSRLAAASAGSGVRLGNLAIGNLPAVP